MPTAAISSRQHPLVQQCRLLERGDPDRLLLDGWHLVEEALAAALPLETVLVDVNVADAHTGTLARCITAGAQVVTGTAQVLAAASPVQTSTGVVAIGRRPEVALSHLLSPAPALLLAAFGLQDPGNAGALIRSAAAAGATGVLLDATSANPYTWKALRASMGTALRLPVRRDADAAGHLAHLRASGLRLIATTPHGGRSLYATDLRGPVCLLLGAEGAGLPPALLDTADDRVHIPMARGVESLNVAVAGALLAFEAARQRRSSGEA